jgi:multidrug resistance efflux pump
MEKPGSTRIISILPEGTPVKAGDVVCTLESSTFVDEVRAQKIRFLQAQSYVEQVRSIYEVNLITLEEYQDGIYPQDVQLVKQYLSTCQIDEERARKNLEWSKATAAKGFRTPSQVMADVLAHEQAVIALTEAKGMLVRLEKYTGPKILTNLKAKNEAIKADLLAQEASFVLEKTRLERLETMVENCILRAPRDGIVVYANKTNGWGRVEDQIDEGVTVREGQQIFHLPDPKHMRVKAKINESKIAYIHVGLPVHISIDAFPDHPLQGTVTEVTAMPAPSNGPMSDVKVYYATVNIDSEGFDELRPGLSAEVTFLVETPRKVTRVPLQAIRYVNSVPYTAVSSGVRAGKSSKQLDWQWRSVTLGQSDARYAEVVNGLAPGEKVISRPELLPAPRIPESPEEIVANSDRPSQG